MSKVDLLFIVDITGSMSGFIQSAKDKMQSILSDLIEKFEVDLKVGLSLYRDHPSQGDPFVTITFDLMDVNEITDKIKEISVDGGGDNAEAVIDGIIDGAASMKWRDDSRKIAFLIGDAPAHGMIPDENCCTCGQTWGKAVAVMQQKKVVVYSILLSTDDNARLNFKTIANFTGGMLIENDDAMDAILSTLKTEFDNINLDSKVLNMLSNKYDVDKICEMLNINRDDLTLSKSRIVQYSM